MGEGAGVLWMHIRDTPVGQSRSFVVFLIVSHLKSLGTDQSDYSDDEAVMQKKKNYNHVYTINTFPSSLGPLSTQ